MSSFDLVYSGGWAEKDLVYGIGPNPSPLCIVGEAPGQNEHVYRKPFVGAAGQELDRILADAGLGPLWKGTGRERTTTRYATNVFKIKPPDTDRAKNDILDFFVSRTDPRACLDLPAYRPGKYLRDDLQAQVAGLIPELAEVGARVVIAFGGTALWALLGHQKISAYAGTVHGPTPTRPFTVIPTYHPSAVIRQWSLRTTVLANLDKVAGLLAESGNRPQPRAQPKTELTVKVNPSLAECQIFAKKAALCPVLGVDVETAHGQIRTISFATSANYAFTIPFWEPPAASYWPTLEGELAAWECVRHICASPGVFVGHNFQYDIQYIWRVHGIPILRHIEDTMLAHHALEPELPKSLGGLASIYLDLPEWKTMRIKSEKGDDE